MKNKKGCFISISIIFLILYIGYRVYDNWNIVDCPPFDRVYFEWFPYNEGDTIRFGNNKEIREYVVASFTGYHKNNYMENVKCGGCSDGVNLSIIGGLDTLNIVFFDFTFLHTNGYYYKVKQKKDTLQCDISLNYINMPRDTIFGITIKKAVGINTFNENHEVWKLKEHKKCMKIKEIEIISENCY